MPAKPRLLTVAGETRAIEEWADRKGLAVETVRCRIDKLGWDVERAVNTPADRRFRKGGRPSSAAPRPCPKLRRHTSGRAFVRWVALGRTHERYFGPWGSSEAVASYSRFAAEWAEGRHLAASVPPAGSGLTVADLAAGWLAWCATEYVKGGRMTSEVHCCRAAVRVLNRLYGRALAAEFGPHQLRATRAEMIRQGWARRSVNLHCSRVVRCFKWGVGQGLLPAHVWQALTAVEWLKAGRSEAREPARKRPAPAADVAATLPHLSLDPARCAVLADMVRVQQLTGMRPGEVCGMRPADLDRSADVWLYTVPPHLNKNEHRDRPQRYFIGPRAQAILARHLDGDPARPVFRLPPRGTAVRRLAYGKAVKAACERAGVAPWTPHQLRHALATEVARHYASAERAALAIGDTPGVAAAVYVHVDPAERQRIDAARELG